jgi:hypothetical protein
MQRMEEGPGASVHQPSRRQALRARAADPVSIPESDRPRRAAAGASRPREAVDSRIEQGLREIGAALTETIRVAAADVARTTQREEPPHPGSDPAESIRALATQIDERLQAIAVRIGKLEDAIQAVASHGAARDGVAQRLDQITQGLGKLAAQQHRGIVRLAQFQQQGMARLASQHRADLKDFARLTGEGVVAVSRKIRDDLTAAIERLQHGNGHTVDVIGDVPSIADTIRAESEGPGE